MSSWVVKVKICGITNKEDAWDAIKAGADGLGFNFYPKSPRYVSIEKAREIIRTLPPFISKIGVFVNESPAQVQKVCDKTGIDGIQLHGDEKPEDCDFGAKTVIKVFRSREIDRVSQYPAISAILLDSPHQGSYGGTGHIFDWTSIQGFKQYGKPVILSGGLGPDNVAEAVQKVRPYGVDACSQLETTPGKKDPEKVREFVSIAKKQ